MQKKRKPYPLAQTTEKALLKLKKMGVFTNEDAIRAGLSRPTLFRLVNKGELTKVRNTIYVHPASKIDPQEYDFAVAAKYFGKEAVVGGLSALFYHGLIDRAPKRIWVVVPYNQKSANTLYRCLRTQTSPKKGVDIHDHFRVTNLERTLVESLRYATKIGLPTALNAVRKALSESRTDERKLLQTAKQLGLQSAIQKHWDAIVA